MQRIYTGLIHGTNQIGQFVLTGYWIGSNNHKIGSYKRIDTWYEEDRKQYSRSRNNVFFVESED